MSERKWTQGPWDVRTLENFGWNVVSYVDGDKHNIDRVAKTVSNANARLIAAAPDLYEALELAVEQLEEHGFDGVASGAYAALNKANPLGVQDD